MAALDPKTLFVTNIPYSTTPEGLAPVFQKYGALQKPRILRQAYKGRMFSRGIGFVEFDTPEACQAALKDQDNISCEGRKLRIAQARVRVERRRDTVFVGKLPPEVSTDDLKAAFANYHPLEARVVYPNKRPGFGYVKMATPEDQEKAVKENRRITIKGSECIVMFARVQFDAPRRIRRRRNNRRAPRGETAPAQGGQ